MTIFFPSFALFSSSFFSYAHITILLAISFLFQFKIGSFIFFCLCTGFLHSSRITITDEWIVLNICVAFVVCSRAKACAISHVFALKCGIQFLQILLSEPASQPASERTPHCSIDFLFVRNYTNNHNNGYCGCVRQIFYTIANCSSSRIRWETSLLAVQLKKYIHTTPINQPTNHPSTT